MSIDLIELDLAALSGVWGGESVNTQQTQTGKVDASVTRTNQAYCLDNVKQRCDDNSRYLFGAGPVDRSASGACQLRDAVAQCLGPPAKAPLSTPDG